MMPLQNTATFVAIKPQSVTSGATASGYVDCLGYSEAAVDVALDSQSSTTSNPSVLKIMEVFLKFVVLVLKYSSLEHICRYREFPCYTCYHIDY